MPDPTSFLWLNHQATFSEIEDMAQTLKLNPAAKRMAGSMKKLFAHIATRDGKAASSPKKSTIIFPAADTPLQAAIQTVLARLTAVL